METIKVRLRLAGRRIYEQPVSLFGNQPPKTGDLIDVPHNGHSVRAQVTSTSSPICREGDLVTYLVYACELENQKKRADDGELTPHLPLAAY
jgi:predicted aconitase with swiveling domain